jgi:hypothetical protein
LDAVGDRNPRTAKKEPLLDMLADMDAHASPTKPHRPSVWICVLAAPLIAEVHASFIAIFLLLLDWRTARGSRRLLIEFISFSFMK